MKINISYDASVASAPIAFDTAVTTAVNLLDELLNTPISVTIAVGWGEVNGQAIGAGVLGEGGPSSVDPITFASAVNALSQTGYTLPSRDPFGGGNGGNDVAFTPAEEKALGIASTPQAIDGYVGFNSDPSLWTYNELGTIAFGTYDLVGVVLHELTHALGRYADVGAGGIPGVYEALDLYRYLSPGVIETSSSIGASNANPYFSVNGGITGLGYFDNTSGGDLGDWNDENGHNNGTGLANDSFNAYSSPGVVNPMSLNDVTVMDALGFQALKNNVTVTDQTMGGAVVAAPLTFYSGPVAGLMFQYIYTGTDSENVTATAANTFVHTGSGTDAIDFSNVIGNNVMDGGTGSNFLVGTTNAASQDTFFLDARAPTADIWSTVVNFHKGDSATIWGITSNNALNWVNDQGAAGYTGLTSHLMINGHEASLTLTGYTTADLTDGHLSLTYGTVGGNSYLHIVEVL